MEESWIMFFEHITKARDPGRAIKVISRGLANLS